MPCRRRCRCPSATSFTDGKLRAGNAALSSEAQQAERIAQPT